MRIFQGVHENIKTNDDNFPSTQNATKKKATINKIPGLSLSKAQKKNLKNKKKKSDANEIDHAALSKNNEDSESDSDYETQKTLPKADEDKIKENQIKITDYFSQENKEEVNPPPTDSHKQNTVSTEFNKETMNQSKGTITDEEENLDELYKSLTTDNKALEQSTNHSTTFFEDNHYKIHETYHSIFEKGGSTAKETLTPSRMLRLPSSSTPRQGTPKRSRSESPNDKIIGINTIKFSNKDVNLLDMKFINPADTNESDVSKTEENSAATETPAST